jgi:hypothetical protein
MIVWCLLSIFLLTFGVTHEIYHHQMQRRPGAAGNVRLCVRRFERLLRQHCVLSEDVVLLLIKQHPG